METKKTAQSFLDNPEFQAFWKNNPGMTMNTAIKKFHRKENQTIVVFRKFKDGDIIALFPAETADASGNCMSYMHVGQHGAADYSHCIGQTTPATPEQYAALKRELENIGYALQVKQRFNRKRV